MILMNKTNITDMTVGSPTKHILKFTLPLLIGNLFQQFYNMVDSLIVGNFVGSNALAAVGTCGSVVFLFFSLTSGLAIGIGVIAAQYFGAKDDEKVKTTIANSFYVLTISSVLVSLIGIIFAPLILKLLQTPSSIINDSVIYMRTTCAGIIAIAFYNGVAAILRALGDSKTPLYFLILSSIINVVLDLLFVLSFHWNVFGVALATIISQFVCAVGCIYYAFKKVPYFNLTKKQLRPHRIIILQTFKAGIPLALQNALIAVSCMVLQGVVNSFGETIMASYTINMRIEQLVQQPYSSLGMALTTYSGQNMGAKDLARVKKGLHRATFIVLIFSLILLPNAWLFSENIVGFFVKDPSVIDIASKALKITSIFYFGLGMIYVPRAILNGAGDTGFAMINGLSEVLCRIILSQIFTRIPLFSYWGIWITTGFTWTITATVCIIRYKTGKWKTKSLINLSKDVSE